LTASLTDPPKATKRRSTFWAGLVVGFATAFGLSAVLALTSGPTPWWAWQAVAAAAAVSVAGLLLIASRSRRRFGLGYVAGVVAALVVDAVLLVGVLSQVTM
jgi:hypothetical protein